MAAKTIGQAVAERSGEAQHQPGAVLAIREDQDFWDAKQLAALSQLGVTGASKADLAIFFHYSQRTGLDPFSRQIYFIKRDGRWTIQVGIDGFRVIARRAARREGCTISYEDSEWADKGGAWSTVWISATDPPLAAKVTVLRDAERFPGVVRYSAYVPLKDGRPTGQWGKMGAEQLEKCAEAKALRRAFPNDLAGVYEPAEMEQGIPEEMRSRPVSRAQATLVAEPEPDPDGDGPASREALRRVAEAFTAAGWETGDSVRPAIRALIDRAVDDDTVLTADEAEFVATEVEGFAGDAAGLLAMIEEHREAKKEDA
jgi:phage recombination protein Bet